VGKQIKNIFISHIHEDDAGLAKLKELLAKNGMDVRDSSINSSKPNEAKSEDYIKSKILAPQIQWAGTLVVYVSPQTKDSKWVNWEIEYAAQQGKRIVGVWEHGSQDCEIPEALSEYGDAMVGWNGSSIIDAIDSEKDTWEKPDGESSASVSLKRHPC
jgi:ribonuclease BN (tRNA processing enzyme)